MKKSSKLAFYSIKPEQKEYIKKSLPSAEFPEELAGDFEVISIFVSDKIDLGKFPNLQLIATRSTGFDHIDLEESNKRGIAISNVPNYGKNTVAEFAFALILALSRKVFPSYEVVQNTGRFIQDGLTGFDLRGKTLGVIGTGNIGSRAVEIGQGFGMKIIGYDINQNLKINYKPLEHLLKKSDIITIHVPYNKHTHYLINKENIKLIKKNSYIINTSRGGVIETQALIKALQEKRLAGAGLDVLENEPEVKEKVLLNMPNVIVTPHNAFNTKEAIRRILDTTIENIKSFVDENKVLNRVNN